MRLSVVTLAAACVAMSSVAPVAASASAVGAAGKVAAAAPTELVFLRAAPSGAARAHAVVRTAQAAVALDVGRLGGTVVARAAVPDALVVRLGASAAAALAADPLVRTVLPDTAIPAAPSPTISLQPARDARRGLAVHAACGSAQRPQLDPEALASIDDAPGATGGFDGKGVTVAFLADGLQPNDPGLLRSARFASPGAPAGAPVVARYVDFSGDGPTAPTAGGEAFLDASSIAAQGTRVYDLDREVGDAHPLASQCDVRIVGAAPGATVEALKVFGQRNLTTASGFVQAIAYAVAHGASVINESFGANDFPDTSVDVVRIADEAAYAAGVTVVASTGDAGVTSTLASPSSDPDVLAVGATTTFRAYQQASFGGINLPGEHDRYLSGNVSSLSSGGVAQDDKTVDLVAPGDLNWSLCSPSPRYANCGGQPVQLAGGTSEAAPLVAGAAADVIEAYRAAHHGARPTPALVMQILTSTATDLGAPADEQGAGLLDVAAAVRLARSIAATTIRPRPGGVLASTTQLNLRGDPGATVGGAVTVTNDGAHPVALRAATRTLVPFRVTGGVVNLDPGEASRQPRFSSWSGMQDVYQRATLHVGRGVARIKLAAAYAYVNQSSPVQVALFTPSGALAGYSIPQGIGDYADVEVGHPVPGAWTAAFFTAWEGGALYLGSQGRVPFTFTELRDAPDGAVTPQATALAPGASATLRYRDVLGASPGDASASIVLTERAGAVAHVTSVPVTLRTLVAMGSAGGHFRGVLTGGNGREDAPGQANTFAFDVPAGEHDLDVAVAMSSNASGPVLPGNQLVGMLVDPSGDVQAYDTNFTERFPDESVSRYLDLYVSDPAEGSWELLLEWAQPTVGARTAIPFTGSVEFDQVAVAATLPDAAATDVASTGATYQLTVRNTGVAPMFVSPDARLTTTTTVPLTDIQGASGRQPFGDAWNVFYVPTAASSVTFTETATVPSTFDASLLNGDPDLSPLERAPYTTTSWTPTRASLTYAPPDGVSPGLWAMVDSELGPYPASGEPRGSLVATATATIRAFDPAVSSPVPDSVESLETGQVMAPAFVPPGTSTTIPITITPTAPAGTTVTGTLFVDGLTIGSIQAETIEQTSLFTSVLAAIPYEYTAG